MKRNSIVLLILIFCNQLFSQDSKILFGIEVTPTISWLGGMQGATDNQFGYSAGIISEYSINSQISIKSGLSYERKGSKSALLFADTTGITFGSFDVNYNYDYLILPILGTFTTKGKVKVFFTAGTYFGYLLSQKNNYEAYHNTPENTIDNSDETKKIDFGLSFGTGVSVPLGSNSAFDLGLKPNLGLINTSKKDNNTLIKVNSLGLSIGFKYKL